jgi:alkanesulfonate monooxygenase SsuD/methylene tetrahydromethanopterin reductase-like flavin-dependent oxidoreductase (luciferase family)
MRISVKLAPTFAYPELEQFWRSADQLGFGAIWNYDHFYGLVDNATPTLEGWTTLAAMGAVVRRARVGCMVTGVTYRNPAILAKMAVTVDHITGGRLDFGIGAGWHEDEHRAFGIEFPSPGTRVAMLDEALTVIRRLWTEESVSFAASTSTDRRRGITTQDAAGNRPPCRRVEHAQPRRSRRVGAGQRPTQRSLRGGRPAPGRGEARSAVVSASP